ncbi:hypothetical protein [Arthrobacter sp. efr-133-R2A-63]|uniref:hypothetical protein n=1 Tax=Arthrobacter sp. efr-133-R2A-63 TaxID=3040278 RepID=UPI00254E9AAC|nr:hypothetical protein [Arthrobacter sp. efr-133-R2A-63]
MIRKEGKARWTYTCEPCSVRVTKPDQFRAIEACHRHERGFGHAQRIMSIAYQAIIDAFSEAVKPVLDVVESIASALAPPPNRPHDPTLLRDRRKWGGR